MKKKCSKCSKTKRLNHFHKDKKGVYGRRSHCKDCCPKAAKQQKCRRCRNHQRVIDFPVGKLVCKPCLDQNEEQYCGVCNKKKKFSQFTNDKTTRNGKHSVCRGCNAPRWKEYYAKDPIGIAAATRNRYQKTENGT